MSLIKKKKVALKEISLNITSLMDVLTVLLFFLVKIFTVNSMNMTVPEGVTLPEAKLAKSVDESVTIIISKDIIATPEKTLHKLRNGQVASEDFKPDKRTLTHLYDYLKEQMDKKNKIFSGTEIENMPAGKIIFYADKDLSFGAIKYVLHTASQANYSNFNFLANKDE